MELIQNEQFLGCIWSPKRAPMDLLPFNSLIYQDQHTSNQTDFASSHMGMGFIHLQFLET